MHKLLEKDDINSEELQTLLQSRDEGEADFLLVDVREDMEYNMGHIKGVDMLKPTSSFPQWAQKLFDENKDKAIVFTCRTGNRSGQVQHIFKRHGHTNVLNHFGGIVTYRGEIERSYA
jgi:rhodanese-related sulfurtransferase